MCWLPAGCSWQAKAAKLLSLPKVTGVVARCSGKCVVDMRGGKLLADPGPASILMCFFIFFLKKTFYALFRNLALVVDERGVGSDCLYGSVSLAVTSG